MKTNGMNIKRTLAAGVGLLAVGATLIGCSSDKEAGPKASGPGSVTGGGNTVVKVEGQDLAGLDLKSVTCVKQGGSINIASAPIGGGAQGLGVVMTDAEIAAIDARREAAAKAAQTKVDPAVEAAAKADLDGNQADKEAVGAAFNAAVKAYKAAHPA